MTDAIDVETAREWLGESGEIAFLDVREEGQHGSGHPLLAVNLPYSRLENDVSRLVPRRSCRVVLLDDMDGVAAKATRRLAGLGYDNLQILAGGATAWSAAGYPLFPSTNVRARVSQRSSSTSSPLPQSRPPSWTRCSAPTKG
jgi:rhodanese-related sulfurtransferase